MDMTPKLTPEQSQALREAGDELTVVDPTTNQVYVNDPCFYIYTSGTTGLPKAGIFKHGRWMKSYGGFGVMAMRLGPKDVMYSTLPLYHATGLCVCWGSAIAGSSGFAIRRKFSASNFWKDARKYNATAIGYVGELCRYLLDQPEKSDDGRNPVRKMVGNGLRPNVWMPFKKRFGIEEICELYAASDGSIGFTGASVNGDAEVWGAELDATAILSENWYLGGALSFTEGEYADGTTLPCNDFDANGVPIIPEGQAAAIAVQLAEQRPQWWVVSTVFR